MIDEARKKEILLEFQEFESQGDRAVNAHPATRYRTGLLGRKIRRAYGWSTLRMAEFCKVETAAVNVWERSPTPLPRREAHKEAIVKWIIALEHMEEQLRNRDKNRQTFS
jgi:hypothetical protein